MRKTRIRRLLLPLLCLNVLAPVTHSRQPGDQKQRRQPSYLYQVSARGGKPGEKKIGFIDQTGKLVIGFDRLPKATETVGEFHEGRAVIYLTKEKADALKGDSLNAVGFIDETGKVVIAPRFDFARDFSEGLAYAEAKGFRGFIDRRGKVVITLNADDFWVGDFHEGLAAVGPRGWNGGWGYIDRSGRRAIKPRYWFADDFSEGLAQVMIDGKFGFINNRGEMVIPPRFDARRVGYVWEGKFDTSRFSEGLACVSLGNLYGYVNRRGDFVIPPQFYRAQEFSEGLAWVVTSDRGRAGWIDKSGGWVVTGVDGRSFSELQNHSSYSNELLDWRYSEGLMPFIIYDGDTPLRGYMDQSGKTVIQPGRFSEIGPFVGSLARVHVGGVEGWSDDYGYIDRTGKFIWRPHWRPQ